MRAAGGDAFVGIGRTGNGDDMANGLWEKLRGARRIELFAALAIAALMALLLLRGGRESRPERTDLEARVERVLSRIEGIGEVSALIRQDEAGNALSALIVIDDAGDIRTCLALQQAVVTLLELEPTKVEIMGRRGAWGGTQ